MAPKIDAISIAVSDLAATMAFYRRLGCTFAPDAGPPHVTTGLGGFDLMFDTLDSLVELGFADEGTTPSGGTIALAAGCDSPAEVDALYAGLAADGFGKREPFDAPWGQRYATVVDPDGTHVDLYATLPGRAPT